MDRALIKQWKNTMGFSYNRDWQEDINIAVEALTNVAEDRNKCYSYSCDCHGDNNGEKSATVVVGTAYSQVEAEKVKSS